MNSVYDQDIQNSVLIFGATLEFWPYSTNSTFKLEDFDLECAKKTLQSC